MQIRYNTPITHETAVKMLGRVRKELAKQKCRSLVSKVIDPLCALTFALPMMMGILYDFNKMAGKEALALASRVPKYTELADFASVKVPALIPHGADNPLLMWFALAVLLPFALCFVVSAVIRLVYRPKVEKTDAEQGVAETAEQLYHSVQKMCAQDNARATGRVNSITVSAIVAISAVFEIYICSNLYPAVDKAARLGTIGAWVLYLVGIGIISLLGLGITESLVAMVSGASNRYGASFIEKDTYEYWCSVDPDENARKFSGMAINTVRKVTVPTIQSNEKTAGIDYVTKVLSGRYKLAALCCVLQNEAMSFAQLTSELKPDSEAEFKQELKELENEGLVSHCFNEAVRSDDFSLTAEGKALAYSINDINKWGVSRMVHK